MAEHDHNQVITCPECGAPRIDGMTCWELLGAIGAWEFQDPELIAEHFLTVASYNLQHPAQFTDEALVWLREAFIDRLDHGVSTEVLRRRASAVYEGKKRVLKRKPERHPVLRPWRMTIADVYIPDHPEGAAERAMKG
ncbi:MAG: DUF5946 family protein [Chloroflexi bacterium]|nr:DUF5946 family protein [Chloroflexota bacterium]